jgi:hypothetical protein
MTKEKDHHRRHVAHRRAVHAVHLPKLPPRHPRTQTRALQSQRIGQGRSTPQAIAIWPHDSQREGNHPQPPQVIAVRVQQ